MGISFMDYSHPLQLGCQYLREANQPLGQRPGPHSVPQGSRIGDRGAPVASCSPSPQQGAGPAPPRPLIFTRTVMCTRNTRDLDFIKKKRAGLGSLIITRRLSASSRPGGARPPPRPPAGGQHGRRAGTTQHGAAPEPRPGLGGGLPAATPSPAAASQALRAGGGRRGMMEEPRVGSN